MTRWQLARGWWDQLAPREQNLLVWMLAVVSLALLWFVAIAPAAAVLKAAPAQIKMLDAQRESMQSMADQARSMQGRSPLTRDDALRELEMSVRQRLGAAAQVSVVGDRATVVLQGVAPQAIAPWLSQARLKARVVATQATLTRVAAGWDGTVVFNLPATP